MHSARLVLAVVTVVAACGPPAPELVRRPKSVPPAVLFKDAAVLDVETGTVSARRDVLVTGDRITSVTDTGAASPPGGATVVDAAGATLLPGLIDMHGHINANSKAVWAGGLPDPDANLRSFLYCGVTTVLDPADADNEAFARREKVRKGELIGPTIYASGPMVTARGGHPVPIITEIVPWFLRWYIVPHFTREVGTVEEARKAAAEIAGFGADVMKLAVDRVPREAPRIENDVLGAAVLEARERGIRSVAHIGTTQDAIDAARAGVAAWMHGVYKERIADDDVAKLAAFKIPMVVTMWVFENYAILGQGPRPPTPLERETQHAQVLADFDKQPDGFESPFLPFVEQLRPLRPAWRENVRRLKDAGVTILAGSDVQSGVFAGPGLHRELALLVEAGLTPAEAIRAATSDAARFLANGKDPDFGTVAAGRRADLLLVEGDPTRDVATLARIRTLMQGGVVLERMPINGGAS